MASYPRLLLRDGTEEEVWGRMCDLLRAESKEHEAEALKDGWQTVDDFFAEPDDDKPAKRSRAAKET
jgi:hypothetical protein